MPHVLVIDEAPAILALLRELLEEGLRVSTRAFPLPDQEQIKSLRPSLIILDPFWPGQTAGWVLL